MNSPDQLAEHLKLTGRIGSGSVAEAFRSVPRHTFLPGVDPAVAYSDEAVVTETADDGRPLSSSSQPAIMSAMLEQLGVEPDQRVLEIGAGTDGTGACGIAVRTFGRDADDVGARLAARVQEWNAQGRPSTAALRIRAYQQDMQADDAAFIIEKRFTKFLLDWNAL